MENNRKPVARKSEIVIQEFENETLIYDLTAHKAFCLNQTSVIVWSLCDGKRNVSQIAFEINKKLKILITEDLVLLALDELCRNNLLENVEKPDTFFLKQNRREIIKKVGLSSMIALPLVSSLVAPLAVSAQSAAAIGTACTLGNPSTCSTSNCLNSGGSGLCCSAISAQANAPGFTLCTSDASAAAFSVRCCSGSASPAAVQACPNAGDTRYTCNPY
jgi:hypothetical protein